MSVRRRRRRKADVLSLATLRAVKARKRAFIREVSELLSDALGFTVRVSLVPPKVDLSADQRRAARRSAAVNRRQIADSAFAPLVPGDRLNDPLPGFLRGDDDEG